MKLTLLATLLIGSTQAAPLIGGGGGRGKSENCPYGPLTEDLQSIGWLFKLATGQAGLMDQGGVFDNIKGLFNGGTKNSNCVYGELFR
ncbi:hypothetical protein CONCODRAFT_9649 [Conidiobolus coronatus NRRL 28638]|uniref:Uncharacterized protein n=1 Tax=Conidiobolus coronatus (strain ATCC 28846 / CBS 209.66 / NRRL 28638) TaxID=796925 RepID=A0A137NZW9_CONC2|nr:hypothetical protein CONCODRAFT_9649 [Conidiobolus coronatus NRRL 28638]|eukprot:KXN68149.1 hypothetical protein CONCODRAFT_9649 [Conidiobolus coronatus NRRL 28638]